MAGPTADRIVALLRERELHTGDPIPPEHELIDQLEVSRNTLREAIRELRTLGILEVRHGFGTFVGAAGLAPVSRTLVFRVISSPDGEAAGLRDLVDVRELIEVAMMPRLAGQLPSPTLERLRALCRAMADPAQRVDADREFHRVLYAGQPNRLVCELVEVFWEAYHAVHAQLRELTEAAYQATVDRHLAIVDALESGSADDAATAMRDHFADLRDRIEEAVERHRAATG